MAKRQRINADNRVQLHDCFGSKNWVLNTNLSRGNVYANSKIGKITADLSFSRDKVITQLVNQKEVKCSNSQDTPLIDSNKLKKQLQVSLSMKTNEFVTMSIKRLLENDISCGLTFLTTLLRFWMHF